MTRQETNLEIIAILLSAALKWPDQRFGQILRNLDVVEEITEGTYEDNTHRIIWAREIIEEPQFILNRMRKNRLVQELLGTKP